MLLPFLNRRRSKMRWLRWGLLVLLLLLLGPLMTVISGTVDVTRDWGTASRESAGLAPDPVETREAVIQLCTAKAPRHPDARAA